MAFIGVVETLKGKRFMSDEPVGAVSHNLKFLGHSDQGGRGDSVQITVLDGYAYIGHMFASGVSVGD
jgi:hypothetical protein